MYVVMAMKLFWMTGLEEVPCLPCIVYS